LRPRPARQRVKALFRVEKRKPGRGAHSSAIERGKELVGRAEQRSGGPEWEHWQGFFLIYFSVFFSFPFYFLFSF
jgi:hypothetical protein